MRLVYTENLHALSLPAGHRFPVRKYDQIYRYFDREHPEIMQLGPRAEWGDVLRVHDPDYVDRVRAGTLSDNEVRRLGFPWSEALITRSRCSVGGTLTALAWAMQCGAAGHIAGGTHHASRARGEGFCVFNDLAVAIAVARHEHGIRRIAVIDLDVHQGNGTAAIFRDDADVFTLSLHGAKNFPFHKETSSHDVPLPDKCGDEAYLAALEEALGAVRDHRPSLLLYQAGVDALEGDRLGRMSLSREGLRSRNALVYALARKLAAPLVVTLGGGYHRDTDQSVAAHIDVYRGLLGAFS